MNRDKLRAKYHESFRKNINNKKDYMNQLLERCFNAISNHPAMFGEHNRPNGSTSKDREEIAALHELAKLYQSRIDLKKGA
jgi:hypothetical protein